jgi:lysozyme
MTFSARALVYGLDVYNGDGVMNWPLIAGDGRDFAFVKATEGIGFTDASLSINESQGTAAGLLIGCYDFARPDTNAPAAEADYYVSQVQAVGGFATGKLLPMLDLETVGDTGAISESAWANAWCAEVKAKTGLNAIVYTYPDFAHNNLDSSIASHPLFIASYDFTTPTSSVISPWTSYAFWQYTSTGRLVGGPTGNVDLDIYNGSLTSLISNYAIGQVAPANLTPEPAGITALLGFGLLSLRRRRRERE